MKDREELIKFLNKKSSYPHNPKNLKHIQTHASDVFIVPPFVYKVKKPVNLRFLDFSSLEKRKYYCEKELKLNRRLCRDIYLSVEPIFEKNGNLSFKNGDSIVEYALKMKKLNEKSFLKNLLKKEKLNKKDFSKIIKKLIIFYRNQPAKKHINEFGKPKKIRFNIDENFNLSEKFVGNTITKTAFETIKFYNNRFFQKKSRLFNERIKKGYIKDCHGDLHLEHINYSPKDIYIFDCIEFNERFRYIDIASDIAFLSMDLDFNGYYEFGEFVVSELSFKIKDKTLFEITDFYKCYRAYVRGKVESIRSESSDIPEKEKKKSIQKAKKYFQLSLKYSLFGSKPTIIVVFGLIATGKSTIAGLLGRELSATVISSDKVRKEITGTKPTERKFKGFKKGIYTIETTNRTYNEIIRRCKSEIKEKRIAILDASFSRRKFRDLVSLGAKKLNANLFFIEAKAPDKIIKGRLIQREKQRSSISDARLGIFEDFKKNYEKPDEINKNQYFEIRTNTNLDKRLLTTLKNIIIKPIGT